MPSELNIACYGIKGHQIYGQIRGLSRARLAAFGGIDAGTFAELKAKHPDAMASTSHHVELDDLLEKEKPDLVSLCSARREDQSQHAIQCLEAGSHVLAEKPMALTLDELGALSKTSQRTGRRVWTMTLMMYYPSVQGLKQVVRSGRLGELVHHYGLKSYPYHPGRPQDRGIDGGIIMQAGIHAVSLIGHVTGLGFSEVFAQDTGKGNPKEGNLQMAANLGFRMSDGSLATIQCNYCNHAGLGAWGNDQLRFHGTEGFAELVDGFQRRMVVIGEQPPEEFPDQAVQHSQVQDIVNALLDGTSTVLTEEEGFAYTRAVIQAQASAGNGSPLSI